MPTYQYACTECDHAFEQFQSFTEDSLTTCPQCAGRLRKVFNAVGVVFKGSGFYRTDSRSDSTSSTSKASSTSAATNSPATNSTATSPASSTATSTSEGSAA